jgi:hypothetical protein
VVKLATITDDFTGNVTTTENLIELFKVSSRKWLKPFLGHPFKESEIFMISKASPTFSSS